LGMLLVYFFVPGTDHVCKSLVDSLLHLAYSH
jgi:hypothetical protein